MKIQEISTACLSMCAKLENNRLAKGVVNELRKADPTLEAARKSVTKSITAKMVDPANVKKTCVAAVAAMSSHVENIKIAQRLLA